MMACTASHLKVEEKEEEEEEETVHQMTNRMKGTRNRASDGGKRKRQGKSSFASCLKYIEEEAGTYFSPLLRLPPFFFGNEHIFLGERIIEERRSSNEMKIVH